MVPRNHVGLRYYLRPRQSIRNHLITLCLVLLQELAGFFIWDTLKACALPCAGRGFRA